MDNFAQLSPEEQDPYFLVAESKSKFNKEILEKDFWVCWVLHRLFSLPKLKDHLTFKGGTSLSKAYKVIERFSEDIDLSIEKSFIGFIDDRDPEKVNTSKLRNSLLKELSTSCESFVAENLLPMLKSDFESILSDTNWNIDLDPQDKQTLLFQYPRLKSNLHPYISKAVKIELGAKSDHWPVTHFVCKPYVSDQIETNLIESSTKLKVLSVERTFWEKATILHMFSHYPEDKPIPIRQSRHFYDFSCLLQNTEVKDKAHSDLELLQRVSKHKSIFFRAGWAKYSEARPGSLKLIPAKRILDFMKKDYKDMSEMFYTTPPDWENIIGSIQSFEISFNKI